MRLTAANTSGKYPQTFRRVRAIVEINGESREMTFLTNNVKWAASTICELYSGWNKAFSRLVGIVRSAVWMDLDIVETLRLYGMIVSKSKRGFPS